MRSLLVTKGVDLLQNICGRLPKRHFPKYVFGRPGGLVVSSLTY